jgi:two-component system CheB/CheR fusion protein
MKRKDSTKRDTTSLRATAERRVRGATRAERASDDRRLLHELQEHQIELELQNEELRNTRRELEAGLELHTELFDYAPVGYATLTIDGDVCAVNHAGAALLKKPRSRLIGKRFAELLTPSSRATFQDLVQRVRQTRERSGCEVARGAGAEGLRRLRLVVTTLTHPPPRMLVSFEDITEQRAWEERVARTEAALREADRRKDEFLALLSHELRNPLAPIRHSLFVLDRAEPGGAQARKAQQIIDRQVTHLTRLIDDLLDVTRITRGKIHLQRERLDLNDLVRQAVDDHRASLAAHDIDLTLTLPRESSWADADPARITQVISNLLGNAEKFTPSGGRVTVNLQREESRAVLRIRDTGVGVEPALQDKLFEPFAQASRTLQRTRDGLGLGLAMVKGLVELHGGSVQLYSAGSGQGTEVTINLGLEADGPRNQEARASVAPARRRVLAVEDNRDGAQSLVDALTLSGHDVKVAHDGPTALEVAASFHPEVVLCDINLPGMDGYAVARAFRLRDGLRDTYLVALTGFAQPEDLRMAREAGFNSHLAKPANVATLEHLFATLS